jgi:hypothetical protein
MTKILTKYGALALAVALMMPLAQALSGTPNTGAQPAPITDPGNFRKL